MEPTTNPVTDATRLDDQGLIQRARDGDADAFEALAASRIPDAYRLASAIVGSQAAAAAATQNALLAAWRELPNLRDLERFDAWFHRILVNECRMQVRHQSRQREVEHRRDRSGCRAFEPARGRRLDAAAGRGARPARRGVRAPRARRPGDGGAPPPRRPAAGRDRGAAAHARGDREVAAAPGARRAAARPGGGRMTTPDRTEDLLRLMLERRAGAPPPGWLLPGVAEQVRQTRQARARPSLARRPCARAGSSPRRWSRWPRWCCSRSPRACS